jgi:predicted DNA-binding transcriptional regulator AlpA
MKKQQRAALKTAEKKAPPVEHDQHIDALRGPPGLRLLTKREILGITGVSFVTIWTWMREGKFPRSREVVGRSMWLSTEVEDWLNRLPVRKLKGDDRATISP